MLRSRISQSSCLQFCVTMIALQSGLPSCAGAQTAQDTPHLTVQSTSSKSPSVATQTKGPIDLLGSGLTAPFSSPDWKSLSTVQQASLKPLASTWENLSDQQKRKWISLSSNYSRMTADEQTKLHNRMKQWAALSPRQREQARLNFAEVKKTLPNQVKTEQWQAYQALSPEEQKRLAKSAQTKPPRTALAAQPAPANKLHQLPAVKNPQLPTSAPLLHKPVAPARPVVASVPMTAAANEQTAK